MFERLMLVVHTVPFHYIFQFLSFFLSVQNVMCFEYAKTFTALRTRCLFPYISSFLLIHLTCARVNLVNFVYSDCFDSLCSSVVFTKRLSSVLIKSIKIQLIYLFIDQNVSLLYFLIRCQFIVII